MLRARGREVRRRSTSCRRHSPTSWARSPIARSCERAMRRRRRGPPRGDAAQAARRDARAPGVRRHQRHRHAESARGRGARGRRRVRLHEHDERVRRRADARRRARPLRGSPRTSCRCPKNIYGVTKVAAEDLCELAARNQELPCVVLRTSRFFPEADDQPAARAAFDDDNLKVNELLYRRVDIEDVVERPPAARSSAPPRSASAATSSARRRRFTATISPSCAAMPRPSSRAACPA